MKQISTTAEMQKEISRLKKEGKTIGFVPTMGYLHEGHLSLIDQSLEKSDVTVLSIFVNPLQFGAGEDFGSYPRDLERDKLLAEQQGVHLFFTPDQKEMYPQKMKTAVKVEEGSEVLCGASRPGHFDGVATVVMKLFQIVAPDTAFFGQKDAQQAAIIQNMIKDFHLSVKLAICPVIREEDGLAMSSRNVKLTEEERKEAPVIFYLLQQMVKQSQKESKVVRAEDAAKLFTRNISGELDYAEILTYPELEVPAPEHEGTLIAAAAVKYSAARLIDNIIWEQGKDETNV